MRICGTCTTEVSAAHETCPACGAHLPEVAHRASATGVTVGAIAVFLAVGYLVWEDGRPSAYERRQNTSTSRSIYLEAAQDTPTRTHGDQANSYLLGLDSATPASIIARCRESTGEYGAAVVQACADGDISAVAALAKYPAGTEPIIRRCKRIGAQHGWAVVRACVDQDIKAEKALSRY